MRSTFAQLNDSAKTLDALEFEPVDLEDAKKTLDREGLIGHITPIQLPPKVVPQVVRQAAPPQELPTDTVRWALSLPAENRPLFLLTHYPKIAIKLASVWSDRTSVQSYFDELMLDHRGDRAGFPREAFDDLMKLQQLLLPTSVLSAVPLANTAAIVEDETALPSDSPLARLMASIEQAQANGSLKR